MTLGFLKFLTQKKKGECWINEKYISKNILHLIKIVYQVKKKKSGELNSAVYVNGEGNGNPLQMSHQLQIFSPIQYVVFSFC